MRLPRMTPYLELQLFYAVLGAALAWSTEALLWRRASLRPRPWRRTLLASAAIGALLLAWLVFIRVADHPHNTLQFVSVALGYYGGAFALPSATLVRLWRERARRRAPRSLVAACILGPVVGLYALLIEPDRLVTSQSVVRFEGWPASTPPLRVVHISDLQTVGACEREREAARTINGLGPDLIVFTGDYAAGPFSDPEPAIEAARAFLQALRRPRLGIVCVPGHSESESLRARIFAGLDVAYLRNEEVELAPFDEMREVRLRIFGARTLHQGFDLASFEVRREPGLATVFVSHEPDVAWRIDGRGVDLHLCGHTHGGQIVVPLLGPPMTLSQLPKRFARGLHEFGDHWMNVNPGLGMEGNHAPRIRFLCPPQIDVLELRGGGERRKPAAVPGRE